jgi:hypothetical protein
MDYIHVARGRSGTNYASVPLQIVGYSTGGDLRYLLFQRLVRLRVNCSLFLQLKLTVRDCLAEIEIL